jgi:hypothetical protein
VKTKPCAEYTKVGENKIVLRRNHVLIMIDRFSELFLNRDCLLNMKTLCEEQDCFSELFLQRDDETVFELTKRRNGGITFVIIIIETTKIYKYWSDFYSKIEFICLTVFLCFKIEIKVLRL